MLRLRKCKIRCFMDISLEVVVVFLVIVGCTSGSGSSSSSSSSTGRYDCVYLYIIDMSSSLSILLDSFV